MVWSKAGSELQEAMLREMDARWHQYAPVALADMPVSTRIFALAPVLAAHRERAPARVGVPLLDEPGLFRLPSVAGELESRSKRGGETGVPIRESLG